MEGKHLWNSCGSEAGKSKKKRTAEPSTRIWKEGMRNQAGEKGETVEARAEAGTGKATVRRNREEKERKKQRPSSEMLKLKADERKLKVKHRSRRRNLKGNHLWNSCGSEAGKDERKPTESQVRKPGKKA